MMKIYPTLMWKRSGPLHSCMLERSTSDSVLVAEVMDSGDDSQENAGHRYAARWVSGGPQDRAQLATLDDARAWVKALVCERKVQL